MYEVRIPLKIKREIKKLPQKYQKLIYEALLDLKEDPHLGKQLQRELTKQYSYRVGVYRILYKFNTKDRVISILKVGHRSNVYN